MSVWFRINFLRVAEIEMWISHTAKNCIPFAKIYTISRIGILIKFLWTYRVAFSHLIFVTSSSHQPSPKPRNIKNLLIHKFITYSRVFVNEIIKTIPDVFKMRSVESLLFFLLPLSSSSSSFGTVCWSY